MKPRTVEWLAKARGDLRVAEIVMADGDGSLRDFVGFHCQQAVEKALKAFLVERGVAFNPSHDLAYLLDICIAADAEFVAMEPDIDGLQPYSVKARYPRDVPATPTGEAIAGFVAAVRRVIDLVSGKVQVP